MSTINKPRLTISLHFLIVSRFPRLSVAFLALAEKLREDNVSDKFEAFGQTLTIRRVFALSPAKIRGKKILEVSSQQIGFTRDNRITEIRNM